MIKIKNTQIWGFEGAIRGTRNPYMSHEKSDSIYCKDIYPNCSNCPIFKDFGKGHSYCISNVSNNIEEIVIGIADMTLAKKLIKGGSEHRKFLRMIHVQAEVLAPRYWWAEMDTYKWVTKNSSSTMHLITKRHLTIDDFSHDDSYSLPALNVYINALNQRISEYEYEENKENKSALFRAIKQLLPEGFNQLRTIDTNYECLLNIYHQRKNHRLSEWSGDNGFCKWISSLPFMSEFISAMENKDEVGKV